MLLTGCLAAPSQAQYNVVDPGTSERHRFDLNVAYISSQNKYGEQQTLPGALLTYGYSSKLGIGVGFGLNSIRPSGSPRIGGFGDITPGFKWRFQEETKKRPQIALGYQLKIPTADAGRGLGSGTLDNTILLTGAKSFGRWVAFSNVGYNFLGGRDGRNNVFLGAGVTYQLTETLVVGAQVYGNSASAPGAKDELAWGAGLRYNFAPDRSFKLMLGKSDRGYSDLNVYAGLAFTFGK